MRRMELKSTNSIVQPATTRRLSALNSWLRARGKLIVACALAVGGVILIINGILGLTLA